MIKNNIVEDQSTPDKVGLFKVGDSYKCQQMITSELMAAFCMLSYDNNPMHLNDSFAIAHGYHGRIAYGNLLGMMLSRLVGVCLPTNEIVIIRQSLDFRLPIYVGDEVRLTAEVAAVHEAISTIQLKLTFQSVAEEPVCTGLCLIKCL